MDLMALQGSLTAEVRLEQVALERRWLLAGPAERVLVSGRGGPGGLETSCLALGLAGAAADAYAKEVVMADFENPGDDVVFGKVRKDFDAKAVAQSDHQIRRTMEELTAKAIEAVKAGR